MRILAAIGALAIIGAGGAAIREEAGEQCILVVGRTTRAAMREALGEAGPGIDVQEHVRDLGAR